MYRKRTISRWGFILASIYVITLILWNTYVFFNQLKENERTKMELWAVAHEELAQEELALDQVGGENAVSETALAIIQSNSTTPMILHTLKENFYSGRNIEERILNNEKTLH